MPKVTIFLFDSNQTFVIERGQQDVEGFHLYSCAKFCPYCVTVWAVISVEGEKGHTAHNTCCLRCGIVNPLGFGRNIPGTLIFNGASQRMDWALLAELPAELIKREMQLTLQAWDRHEQNFRRDWL